MFYANPPMKMSLNETLWFLSGQKMSSGQASGSFSLSDQRGQMKVTVNVYSTSGYYGYLETFIAV